MTADDFTRPERAAQIREAKRYKLAIERRGLCSACVHRKVDVYWGMKRWSCNGKSDLRQAPGCETDGRLPKFEFDPAVLKEFKDG